MYKSNCMYKKHRNNKNAKTVNCMFLLKDTKIAACPFESFCSSSSKSRSGNKNEI